MITESKFLKPQIVGDPDFKDRYYLTGVDFTLFTEEDRRSLITEMDAALQKMVGTVLVDGVRRKVIP